MNIFKSGEEVSLSISPCVDKFAFDGCCYYFTCSCEIIKLDSCLCFAGCCKTRRPYDCICYDSLEDCFWASSQRDCGIIFKLNRSFMEIDRILVCGPRCTSGVIMGLSYNCCGNTLTVAYPNCIAEVDKCSGCVSVRYESQCGWITGVMSLCPGYFITCVEDCRQFIYVIDPCGRVLNRCLVDNDIVVSNMVLNPCVSNYPQLYLEFLVMRKGCYPYFYRRTLLADDLGYLPYPCNYDCRVPAAQSEAAH